MTPYRVDGSVVEFLKVLGPLTAGHGACPSTATRRGDHEQRVRYLARATRFCR